MVEANNHPIVMEEITDPGEIARAGAQLERFERNWDWLEARATEAYGHRGKFICVAGQELFVANTLAEVLATAKAAHPDDDGRVTRYIPLEKGPRIYANRW